MFYAELKRGFSKLSFKIALLIGFVFVILHVIGIIPIKSPIDNVSNYISGYIVNSYEMFMLFRLSGEGNSFVIMIPLLSAIVYADSYIEDSKGKVSNYIYTRERKEGYSICKYTVNFILSGVVIVIPLLLDMLICAMLYPSTPMDPMLGGWYIEEGFLPGLLYLNAIGYVLLRIFICFMLAGAYSSIALAAGVFIKKKFAVVIIPFAVSMLIMFATDIADKFSYNHVGILYGFGSSVSIASIHFLIVFLISFLIFYYGVKKSEF